MSQMKLIAALSLGVLLCLAADVQAQKDDSAAKIQRLTASAEKGDRFDQFSLGLRYGIGNGVAEDDVEAVKWFRKSAEQNFSAAQSALGACYKNGFGVTKDYVEACKWLNLAAAQGNETARKHRDALEKKMSPDQIAEGRKRAREFKPK